MSAISDLLHFKLFHRKYSYRNLEKLNYFTVDLTQNVWRNLAHIFQQPEKLTFFFLADQRPCSCLQNVIFMSLLSNTLSYVSGSSFIKNEKVNNGNNWPTLTLKVALKIGYIHGNWYFSAIFMVKLFCM